MKFAGIISENENLKRDNEDLKEDNLNLRQIIINDISEIKDILVSKRSISIGIIRKEKEKYFEYGYRMTMVNISLRIITKLKITLAELVKMQAKLMNIL